MRLLDEAGVTFVAAPQMPKIGEICNAASVWRGAKGHRAACISEVLQKLVDQITSHLVFAPTSEIVLLRPGSPTLCDDLARAWLKNFPDTQVHAVDSPVISAAETAVHHFQLRRGLGVRTYKIYSAYELLRRAALPNGETVLVIVSLQQGYNLQTCLCSDLLKYLTSNFSGGSPLLAICVDEDSVRFEELTLGEAVDRSQSLSTARVPLTLALYPLQ